MGCSTPGFPILAQTSPLSQWCHPTISCSVIPFSSCLQSFPASRSFLMSQLFASGSQKCWHFLMSQLFASGSQKCWHLSISPSNECSGLISFRIDWFDLLADQGILKSLLQHHSSKASVLQHLAFFMVQCTHSYTTTGKITTLTIWTLVGKVTSLLFNISV